VQTGELIKISLSDGREVVGIILDTHENTSGFLDHQVLFENRIKWLNDLELALLLVKPLACN
jgi:hypothetical protein